MINFINRDSVYLHFLAFIFTNLMQNEIVSVFIPPLPAQAGDPACVVRVFARWVYR